MINQSGLRQFPDALVGAIYGGLAQEVPWSDALELLRVALDSNVACLRVSLKGSRPREYLFAAGPKANQDAISEWEMRSAAEVLPVVLQPGQPRVVNWAEIACPSYISEMLERYGVGYSAMILIGADDGIEYILQLSRDGSEQNYNDDELALLRLVGEHFCRALKLRRELIGARVTSQFQSDTLDRLGIAAILVGPSRQFKVLNKTAEEMLAACEGLHIAGGVLQAVDELDDRHFQSALKEVLGSESAERSRAMLIRQEGEGRDLNLLVTARRSVSLISDRVETCALVFLRRSSVASDADVEVLRQLFSFTRAEAKLALGLAKGMRLEDVESELNIRHNTARAHLRSMFSKAEVTRQAELIHLLANCLAPLGRSLEKSPGSSRLLN